MDTTLGRSGLTGSSVAVGTWQLSGHWGSFDEDQAIAAVRRARELGVTVFDTAHAYGLGQAERVLARALQDDLRREDVVVVTKGGLRFGADGPHPDSDPAWLREGVETSLRSLGVDQLDVYLLHAPDPRIPLAETAAFLAGYVDKGVIKHVGVSNFDVAQTAEFAAVLPVEVVQPPYNLFQRDIESDVLPYAAQNDLGVVAYAPLAHGLLSGALRPHTTFAPDDWRAYAPYFQGDPYRWALALVDRLTAVAHDQFGVPVARLAIAWALAHQAVDSVVVGTRNPAHVEEAVSATTLHLGPLELSAVEGALAPAGARS